MATANEFLPPLPPWSVESDGLHYEGQLAIDAHVGLYHAGDDVHLLARTCGDDGGDVLYDQPLPLAVLDFRERLEDHLGRELPVDLQGMQSWLADALVDHFPTHAVANTDEVGQSFIHKLYGVDDPDLAALFLRLEFLLILTDPDTWIATMAAAASVGLVDDHPLWMLLVANASGGKTEAISALKSAADRQLSDITLAGLLSQRPSGPKSGLLATLGNGCNAFVTISDFSSLLGRGSVSGDQQTGIFDALRDIYDGEYSRMMDRVSPRWQGRLSLLAGVTPAVDQVSAFSNALGPRFLSWRMPEMTDDERDAVHEMVANREAGTDRARSEVMETVGRMVEEARGRLARDEVHLSSAVKRVVGVTADLGTRGRSTVPRDTYGRRDICGVPISEEPGRLTGQLAKFARGLQALNIGEAAVLRLARRAGLSTIRPDRRQVLRLLARRNYEGKELWTTTSEVYRTTGLDRKVVERALGDWEALRVVERRMDDGHDDADIVTTKSKEWRLDHRRRGLVLEAFGDLALDPFRDDPATDD